MLTGPSSNASWGHTKTPRFIAKPPHKTGWVWVAADSKGFARIQDSESCSCPSQPLSCLSMSQFQGCRCQPRMELAMFVTGSVGTRYGDIELQPTNMLVLRSGQRFPESLRPRRAKPPCRHAPQQCWRRTCLPGSATAARIYGHAASRCTCMHSDLNSCHHVCGHICAYISNAVALSNSP